MINLEEATRKAKEYLGEAGFPTLVLRLRRANRDDRNHRWSLTFEHIFDPAETLHVELDGETAEVKEFRRERNGGI